MSSSPPVIDVEAAATAPSTPVEPAPTENLEDLILNEMEAIDVRGSADCVLQLGTVLVTCWCCKLAHK